MVVVVVVLDMDETLGVWRDDLFHVRPNVDLLLKMLRCMNADVILWSLGDDPYVKRVVNHYLPLVKASAFKVFARKEAKRAKDMYGYSKSGCHIRDMYEEDIFLVGVDDLADVNMDSAYDVKIQVEPYKKPDPTDTAVWDMCERIVKGVHATKDLSPYPASR